MTVLRLAEKGRGRALRAAWSSSDAPMLPYMDVDLSTDLAGLLPLVAPLISATTPCCGGTLRARFSDAQCGFKAIRADIAAALLPLVEDTGWFFDTELLVLAERTGLRIHEVPVDWIDHPDSRVDIAATALAELHGVARLGRTLATRTLPLAALRAQFGRAPLTPPMAGGSSGPNLPVRLSRLLADQSRPRPTHPPRQFPVWRRSPSLDHRGGAGTGRVPMTFQILPLAFDSI